MNKRQLRKLIKEVLIGIDLYSLSAEQISMLTIAQESAMGEFIEQIHGPAEGIIQMEKPTFDWLVDYLTNTNVKLGEKILDYCNMKTFRWQDVGTDLDFQICMLRVRYLVVPKRLPEHTDLNGMWKYYKIYYNSVLGKATKEEFYRNYKKYVQ